MFDQMPVVLAAAEHHCLTPWFWGPVGQETPEKKEQEKQELHLIPLQHGKRSESRQGYQAFQKKNNLSHRKMVWNFKKL